MGALAHFWLTLQGMLTKRRAKTIRLRNRAASNVDSDPEFDNSDKRAPRKLAHWPAVKALGMP